MEKKTNRIIYRRSLTPPKKGMTSLMKATKRKALQKILKQIYRPVHKTQRDGKNKSVKERSLPATSKTSNKIKDKSP
jgi:hypothetical protein